MNPDWLKLAAGLLDTASDLLSYRGCNDWPWPKGWSSEQRRELVVAMHEDNFGRPVAKFSANELEDMEHHIAGANGPPDWWVAKFLAGQLEKG